MKKWIFLIDNKNAPNYSNERSYYDDECPIGFSKSFRTVRNNVVHTDYRRLDSEKRISLSEFYDKYHKYIMLLFNEARYWWEIDDYESIEFGEIRDFNNIIHND